MTEPLSPEQLDAIGWRRPAGPRRLTNQFHYYRLTHDHRILWGGYDAVYHFGAARRGTSYDQRPADVRAARPAFLRDVPAAGGPAVHATAGAARSTPARASAPSSARPTRGRAAYALGYTGLGVGATRFGADVMLDLLDGADTERTELEMVREQAAAVPARAVRVGRHPATRRSLARADRHQGDATSGCARSTGSASASTPDHAGHAFRAAYP